MIRERVDRLLRRLAVERQFPSQGRTLFIDLERRELRSAYAPRKLVDVFLGGRGMNMFYLANLLDPSLEPLSPDIPLIYGAGIATGIIPSASRGNPMNCPAMGSSSCRACPRIQRPIVPAPGRGPPTLSGPTSPSRSGSPGRP